MSVYGSRAQPWEIVAPLLEVLYAEPSSFDVKDRLLQMPRMLELLGRLSGHVVICVVLVGFGNVCVLLFVYSCFRRFMLKKPKRKQHRNSMALWWW